ncbi:MAG: BatA domain-containing protein, partial [Maioricimonas sp. JB049]
MTLLNPMILYGLGFVLVPVILHFLLRQKPKLLAFPALRLIEERRRQNVRRFRLRHIWLLLLRMLVIGLIVLALTRPALPAANYSLNLLESLTLAGIVILAVGAYLLTLRVWKRRTLPRHVFHYRRTTLRGWTTGVAILLILLCVGWPYQRRIAEEITAPMPTGELDLPVASVFLFDVSLSMGYQQAGQTQLDRAREIASTHLGDLPAGSRVAVTDNANDNPVLFHTTMQSTRARLDALAISPRTLSLDDRLRSALLLQREDRQRTLAEQGEVAEATRTDRYIRRVYIFTDMARSAWRTSSSRQLVRELEELENVHLFLIDVGNEQPQNTGIVDLTLSRQRVPDGGHLMVSGTVQATGQSGERVVELYLRDNRGQSVKHGQEQVILEAGMPQRVEFPMLTNLAGPVVHGEIRLAARDPLEMDDVRYFTVEVAPPPRVLIVAPQREDVDAWSLTLVPHDRDHNNQIDFETEFVPTSQLASTQLAEYGVVCLINVTRLSDDEWYRIGQYVNNGGGLAVFLGSIDLVAVGDGGYNRAQAQEFLPAELHSWQPENEAGWNLVIDNTSHPLFRKLKALESYGTFAILRNEALVYRFWKVIPAAGAAVLTRLTDPEQSPLIIERVHGKGRTLMMTTDVDLKWRRWNNFPTMVNWWAYQVLAEQMMEYLARASDRIFVFGSQENPVLYFEPENADREFLLRRPTLTQSR